VPLLVISTTCPPGRASLVGTLASHRDAKLLYGIERDGKHRVETCIGSGAVGVRALIAAGGGAGGLGDETGVLIIVDVRAIQCDVVSGRAARPGPHRSR